MRACNILVSFRFRRVPGEHSWSALLKFLMSGSSFNSSSLSLSVLAASPVSSHKTSCNGLPGGSTTSSSLGLNMNSSVFSRSSSSPARDCGVSTPVDLGKPLVCIAAQWMQSIGWFSSHTIAAGSTLGSALNVYFLSLESMAALWSSPKLMGVWQVISMGILLTNPFADLYLVSLAGHPPCVTIYNTIKTRIKHKMYRIYLALETETESCL